MTRQKTFLALIVGLVVTSILIACAQTPSQQTGAQGGKLPNTQLVFAGTITSSSLFPANVMMGELLGSIPNVKVAVESVGSGVAAGEAVAKGTHLMGQTSAQGLYQAYHGVMDYKEQGPVWKDLRAFAISGLFPENPVVLDTIKSRKDLSGKTVGVSKGTGGTMAKQFYEANGITNVNWVETLDTEVIIEKMKRGEYVGFLGKGGKADAMIARIMVEAPNTYLLPATAQEIKTANEKFPGQFTAITTPANMFPRQTQTVSTYVITVIDVAHASLPESVVYEMAKVVYQNRAKLAAINVSVDAYGDFPDNVLQYVMTPLHPGLIKFIREDLKKTVPDNLIPPEMKK